MINTWPTCDKPVDRLILGTAALTTTEDSYRVLDEAYAMGWRTLDTARSYGDGESESCIGEWLHRRRRAEGMTVITKGGHPSRDRARLSFGELKSDVEASLAALRTGALDIFLLHRDDSSVAVEEIIDSLNELRRRGYVRAFGVANWSVRRVEGAQQYAQRNALQGFCASSVHLSLAEWNRPPWVGCHSIAGDSRAAERSWYAADMLPMLAWSSLAQGFFSSSVGVPTPGHCRQAVADVYVSRRNLERYRRVSMLALRKGVTVAQIALAYVLGESARTHAIVATRQRDHLSENLAALDVQLEQEERRWLNLEMDEPRT